LIFLLLLVVAVAVVHLAAKTLVAAAAPAVIYQAQDYQLHLKRITPLRLAPAAPVVSLVERL
jgi:hypothetical protein